MKFVTYQRDGDQPKPAVLHESRLFELASSGFDTMLALIAAGAVGFEAARQRLAGDSIPAAEARLLAPIARPPRIFCIGLNYASHASESKMAVQKVPTVFMKLASSVTGPDTDVILPFNSGEPDYEAELAAVVGRAGYRIPASEWQKHIFGYTILNDVSARDIQLATTQWTLGKSFPTFSPLGPAIVSADEVGDPHALEIELAIDGEVLQHANTANLIFKLPQLIEHISAYTPLEPGDILSTGTPEGVGLGRSPKRWLKPGEEMVVRIQNIGELRNRTRAETAA